MAVALVDRASTAGERLLGPPPSYGRGSDKMPPAWLTTLVPRSRLRNDRRTVENYSSRAGAVVADSSTSVPLAVLMCFARGATFRYPRN